MKQIWIQNGSIFSKGDANTKAHANGLPKGIYEVGLSKTGFYLNHLADWFVFDYKIYNLNDDFISYIIKTYDNTTGNLGIIFDGIKGTGKTLTAKVLCNKLQLPVILVKSMGKDVDSNLINYLSTEIDFDCVFFFDEYEKEFKDSSLVLSFMDGVHNSVHRKIFLLTTNNLYIDSNLIGRPSRIRYKKSFGNLSEEVVREILEDALDDKSAIDSIVDLTHTMSIVTIDLVKAIATEVNIHSRYCLDTIKDIFNIEFARYAYSCTCISAREDTHINIEDIDKVIEKYNRYLSLKLVKHKTEEESQEFMQFYKNYYVSCDNTMNTKSLEYIKPGDKFMTATVVYVNVKKRYLVYMKDYGDLEIAIVDKCYMSSANSQLSLVL